MNIMQKFKSSGSGDLPGVVKYRLNEAKPDLLFGFGIVGVLAGTVLACLKTAEAKKEIEAHKEAIKVIEDQYQIREELPKEEKRQLKIQKGRKYIRQYGVLMYKMAKIYGLAAVLWGTGMISFTDAHFTLKSAFADSVGKTVAAQQLLSQYRGHVAEKIGEEEEKKLFLGAREETIQVLEKDPETGEEKLVEKTGDVFYAQPGSIYARNFTEQTSDAFDIRSYADRYLQARIDKINLDLKLGVKRFYTGQEILRMLGFNENELTDDFIDVGISGNARLVADPECRELKVTRLKGYERVWDPVRECFLAVPCLRLDFNFYPLKGRV